MSARPGCSRGPRASTRTLWSRPPTPGTPQETRARRGPPLFPSSGTRGGLGVCFREVSDTWGRFCDPLPKPHTASRADLIDRTVLETDNGPGCGPHRGRLCYRKRASARPSTHRAPVYGQKVPVTARTPAFTVLG